MHTITVYKDEAGRWRWRRQAGNWRVVAASEQGFRRRGTALRDAKREMPAGVDYRVAIILK